MAAIGTAIAGVYEKATRICISAEGRQALGLEDKSDETDSAVGAGLSMAFYEKILFNSWMVRGSKPRELQTLLTS